MRGTTPRATSPLEPVIAPTRPDRELRGWRSPSTRRRLTTFHHLPSLILRLGASLASGIGLALAFPPFGLWPLAFVTLVPLLWAIRGSSPSRTAICGFVFGVGGFGILLSWIARFGTGAFVSLVLLLAGFAVVFSLIARLVLRSPSRILRTGGVAAAWTLVEQWRGAWPLGGFTWGSLGISQVENPLILPLARVSGSVGITLAVAAVNMLVLEFLIDRHHSRRRYALLLAAGLVAVAPVAIPLAEPSGGPLRIVSLQVDVRRARSLSPAAEDREVAQLHVERHRRLAEGPGADLAVWGEGSLDPEASADPITMSAVTDVIREVGIPTIVGASPTDAEGQRTSALAFDGTGRLVGRYDKSHLVPFGEYVPWRSQLSWFEALDQIPVDRVAGDGAEPIVSTSLPAIGTPICFENAFPGLVREMVRNGATLLVVPVNNASYGFSAASEQHLQMSRMRAVETDRWVVNAGVSGITAIVDPTGQVSARTELFEDATLRATVFTNDAWTPFVRWGDWVVWAAGALLGLSLLGARRVVTVYPRGVWYQHYRDGRLSMIDPVCGMTVQRETAAAAWEHEGVIYLFCSVGCMQRFREDPERFLALDPSDRSM